MSEKRTAHNSWIDLWKFLFAIIIVLHHSKSLRGEDVSLFLGGSIAVEFYFIVSGYLMASKGTARSLNRSSSIGKETFLYVKKKFGSLIPQIAIAIIFSLIVEEAYKQESLGQIVQKLFSGIWPVFLVSYSGIEGYTINAVTWYISALLILSLVLYPVLLKNRHMFFYVVAPLAVMFCFGYLYKNFNSPRDPFNWLGFCYKGLIRGLGDVCVGTICYKIVAGLSEKQLTKPGKVLFTVIECSCYLFVVYASYKYKASDNDYFFIVLLAIGVSLSFGAKTYTAHLVPERWGRALGSFSLSLYLSHVYWAKVLGKLLPEWSYQELLPLYIAIAIANAFLLRIVYRFCKELVRAVRQRIRLYES